MTKVKTILAYVLVGVGIAICLYPYTAAIGMMIAFKLGIIG